MISTIAFDADDTLWHNQPLYNMTIERFADLLSRYHDRDWITARLDEVEGGNLHYYGYGVKSFALSMIQTAIELTEGRITGGELQNILDYTRMMLEAPIEIMPNVREVISQLDPSHFLMVITKGDLLDQESKVARSGLGDLFDHVEVVSEKNPDTYRKLLTRLDLKPQEFLMVGNSLPSDVLPIVEIGGTGVHIPYPTTWSLEQIDISAVQRATYYELEDIGQLPKLLADINGLIR